MWKRFIILAVPLLLLAAFPPGATGQTYLVNQVLNAGNPGGLNTESDATTTGWTQFLPGSQSANIWSSTQSIPFSFQYFGNPVTHFKASLNGLVTFDTTVTGTPPNENTNLPGGTLPPNTIACYWDEFTNAPPTGSNDVVHWKIFGSAPNRQFWIRWFSFEYGNPFISFAYFAVVLEETSNKIYLVDQYSSASPLLNTTAGVQMNTSTAVQFGDSTLQIAGNGSANADNDYLEFFVPLAFDMSVTSFLNLPGSAPPGSPVNFQVSLANLGTNAVPADTLRIFKNGSLVSSLQYAPLASGAMDTVNASITSSASGRDTIIAALKTVPGDGNLANDTLSATVLIDTVYASPYFEHFDSTTAGTPGTLPPNWTNAGGDDFEWWVEESGIQNSSGTGPIADHTSGTGNYMYTEASSPNFPSKRADLLSPFINLTGLTNPVVEFWFHMYGAAMGELHIDAYANGMWVNDIRPPLVGQFQTAETDPWLKGVANLAPYAGSIIQIRFRGITGSNFTSDMAIDDFRIGEAVFDIQANALENPKLTMMPLTQTGLVSTIGFQVGFTNTGPSNTGNINLSVANGGPAFSDVLSGVSFTGFSDSVFSFAPWNASGASPALYTATMFSSGFTDGNPANDTTRSTLELGSKLGYDKGNHTNSIAIISTNRSVLGTRFTLTNPDTLTSVEALITSSTTAGDSFAIDIYTAVADTPGTLIARIHRGTYGDLGTLPALVRFVVLGGLPLPAGDFYTILDSDSSGNANFPLGADATAFGATKVPRRFGGRSPGFNANAWTFFETVPNPLFATLTNIMRAGFQESTEVHDFAVKSVEAQACMVVGRTYSVESEIENVGNQDETNVTIELRANGVFVDDAIISLNAGATTTVTFDYSPADTGIVTLMALSQLAGDVNPSNDTSRVRVRVLGATRSIAFVDNFSDTAFTSANWTVTNEGGTGVWKVYPVPYPNAYTLPITSAGNVFSADADDWGSGTTTLTSAILSLNLASYSSVYLDFDSDWRILDTEDTARVRVSTDNGTTWTTVLEYPGVSARNEHLSLDLTSQLAMRPNAMIRFQSIQPGWDWWWTIDNVCISGTMAVPPAYVQSFEGTFPPKNWIKLNPDGGSGWNRQANGTTPIPGWTGGMITVPPGGGNFVAFCTWNTGGPTSNDQWLVSPRLLSVAAADSFAFWLRYWPNSFRDTLEVRMSTTGNGDPSNFTIRVDTLGFGATSDTNWVRYAYRLGDHVSAGSNVYLGFRERVADNFNDGASFSFDLFSTTAMVDTSTPPAKLLITEFVVTPTAAEFIEIYNPTADTVNLTDYYLTDATFAGDGSYYYNIVRDTLFGGGGFGDFHSRFPAGARIPPGRYQTVALNGNADFFTAYGVNPTYEIDQPEFASGTPDTIPNMREVKRGSIYGADSTHNPGLTNGDEVIILYYWNGLSDLVGDVDYVLYNSGSPVPNDEAVDKTGILIDGPDPDTIRSAYLNDVPIASQRSAPNHTSSGVSVHRIDLTEGTQITSGGNGVTGSNEMSENLDATFSNNSRPTPNAPYQPLVGVAEGPDGIPETYVLAQNYPNPFNPSTVIRFGLPTQSSVTVKVYNILGQGVVTLVDGVLPAGYYDAEWNGRNTAGVPVASGIYFYRLEATAADGSTSFITLKKMLMVK